MGVRKDLKRAKRRADLAGRTTVETVKDENGTVREVRSKVLAAHPASGTTADIPFTNADEAPDAVVLRREEGARGARSRRRPSPGRSPPWPRAWSRPVSSRATGSP